MQMVHAKPIFFQSNDGLRICYSEFGNPNGKPLFFFHGSPGSRLEALYLHELALEYGYRVIAPDRPGMGESDYKPVRSWLDYPEDIIQLASHLKISKFGVLGISGGGPAMFSCAYKIPKMLEFVIGFSVWAPNINGELYKHLAPIDRYFNRLDRIPFVFQILYAMMGIVVKVQSGKKLMMNFKSSMCEADLEFVKNNEEMVKLLARDIKESFKHGSKGPARDAILQYRDWGFDLSKLTVPIRLYHGTADKFVPFSFAKAIHRVLPNSSLRIYPNEGHYSLMNRFDDVFQDLDKSRNNNVF